MRLIYLSLAWTAGIYLSKMAGSFWIAVSATVLMTLLSLALPRHRALLLVFCLVVFLGGMLRFQSTEMRAADEHDLRFYNGQSLVRIEGVVAADPESSGKAVALRLNAREIKVGNSGQPARISGSALAYVPRYPPTNFLPAGASRDFPYYRYGDLITFTGSLQALPEMDGSTYKEYLAREGIYSVMQYPADLKLVSAGQGFRPLQWLYGARNRLAQSLESALHQPQASIAQAVLLGKDASIPDDLSASFALTGTRHILAISGLHVSIVAGVILSLVVWLFGRRRPTYFLFALGAIWAYAFLTGLQPPVLRATIMGSLWLTANHIGRPNSALPSLLLAGAVMVGVQPSIMGDVSFQLSFAAMAGLVLLTPKLQVLGRRIAGRTDDGRSWRDFLIDSVAVTLGAVLTTLPLIAFYFHKVSLVTLPANLFAVPVLPAIILTSGLVAIIGVFAMPLAQILGWVSWLSITYLIEAVRFFAFIPLAAVDIGPKSAIWVWIYYSVLGIALWLAAMGGLAAAFFVKAKQLLSSVPNRLKTMPFKPVAGPLLMVAVMVWVAAFTAPDNRLHVFFLDVGQGDAIMIRTPAGHTILIDGGPAEGDTAKQIGQRMPFWRRGFDLVVLTHPQEDHLSGLTEVLRTYRVAQVLEGPSTYLSATYDEWRRLIGEKEIKRTTAEVGQTIDLGEKATITVLNPAATIGGTVGDVNNSSLVLRLSYENFSLLLTGDIEEDAERRLINQSADLRSTALKVAHHGSDTSTSPQFLEKVKPQLAIISVGEDNTFGHPDKVVLQRLNGIPLYRTDERGTIELISDGNRLWVRTER